MHAPVRIPLPLPHIGSVNAWLLRGDPLTLIDTGPCDDEALAALEAGLRRAGVRLEDLELVLVTHHHLDHSGLAATIAARSGARIAAYERAAAYGAHYEERGEADRRFSLALMRHHGVPETVIADTEAFWEFLRRQSDPYTADVVLADGEHIRAGGRDLRVVARPGHSTTDALLVDERERIAFVGDHLLAKISSNTEIYPALEPTGSRPRARVEYLESLRRTAAMPLRAPAHRARRGHHRSRRARRAAAGRPRAPLRADRQPRSGPARPPRTGSPPTCGPRRPSSSSPCSSSGRCSGTSTCCWTPDASASR